MSALHEHLGAVPLIDHHVHGCWLQPRDRTTFENALNEANTEPLADFDSGFDTQLGFAVRAHCATALGLARHAEADDYWDRRTAVPEAQLAHHFLAAAGVSDWLVDTGTPGVASLGELSGLAVGGVYEVVRLESIAEEAAARPGDYAAAFDEILADRARTAVGTKSVLAYRGGFVGELSDPAPGRLPRRPHAGATLVAFASPTGCCCGSDCTARCGSGSRCSCMSASAIATRTYRRPIRFTCSTSCGAAVRPR